MFDIAGKDSLKAAEDADLYKAFAYLSFRAAKAKVDEEIIREQQKK